MSSSHESALAGDLFIEWHIIIHEISMDLFWWSAERETFARLLGREE
jgi:hypothetical protein